MYGVIIEVKIDGEVPGSAGGRWLAALEAYGGMAVMLFDCEETARGFAELVAYQGPLADRAVWSFQGLGTYEVMTRG